MRNIKTGLLGGIIAGGIDIIPMVIQHLPWEANLSAFVFWVVTGILIASSEIKLSPIFKGVSIAFLVFLPVGILVGAKDPLTLIPMISMTIILSSVLGYFLHK